MVDVHSGPLIPRWDLAENIYSILREGSRSVDPLHVPFPDWQPLFEDLKREKYAVKRQQQLGRLIPQPAFINDFEKKSEAIFNPRLENGGRDDPNHDPRLLEKARRVCHRFRVLFWCAYKLHNIDLNVFAVLAESLVMEWPVELGEKMSWDKAPLFIQDHSNRSMGKASKSSTENESDEERERKRPRYQLRFLALEGLWKMEQEEWIYVEVHHSLHEKFTDISQKMDPMGEDIIGQIFDLDRTPSYEYYMALRPTKGPNKRFLEKTIQRKIFYDQTEKTEIRISNLDIHYAGLEKSLGRNRYFVIRSNILISTNRGTLQIAPDQTYPFHSFDLFHNLPEYELEERESFSQTKKTRDSLPYEYYLMDVESAPFLLQSNPCKQFFQHYFDAAWKVFNDYHQPERHKIIREDSGQKGGARKNQRKAQAESYDEAKIEMSHVLVWLAGIIPSMCSKWCRLSDSKEISHLARMLLFRKICGIAFGKREEWLRRALQLESQLFLKNGLSDKDRLTPKRWVRSMHEKLLDLQTAYPESLLIVKADLNDIRYVVRKDFMIDQRELSEELLEELEIGPTDSSLITWLLHVGKSVDDPSGKLGTTNPEVGQSTLYLYNNKYLTIRSPECCLRIATKYNNSQENPPLAHIMTFSETQCAQLRFTFTRTTPESEIYHGKVPISMIGQLRKLEKGSERVEEAKGLRAYLCQGNLANYRYIVQIQLLNGRDHFYPYFIYGDDAIARGFPEKNSIFTTRPQMISQRYEVDPVFGKIPMINHQFDYPFNPISEPAVTRNFVEMRISNDRRDSLSRKREFDDDVIPCKKPNQNNETELPGTSRQDSPFQANFSFWQEEFFWFDAGESQFPPCGPGSSRHQFSPLEPLTRETQQSNRKVNFVNWQKDFLTMFGKQSEQDPSTISGPSKQTLQQEGSSSQKMYCSHQNHLGMPICPYGIFGLHREADNRSLIFDPHQHNDAQMSSRERSRTSSDEFPLCQSQTSSSQESSTSPSFLIRVNPPQTPELMRDFEDDDSPEDTRF